MPSRHLPSDETRLRDFLVTVVLPTFNLGFSTFLIGLILFSSHPRVADPTGEHLTVPESSLVSLKGVIDGVVLSRGLKATIVRVKRDF